MTLKSMAGSIEIQGTRPRIDCHFGCDLIAAGNITLPERTRITASKIRVDMDAGGDITLDSPRIKGDEGIRIAGEKVHVVGALLARTAADGGVRIEAGAAGSIRIDQLKAKGSPHGAIEILGGSIEIGRPGATGKIKTSSVRGSPTLDVDASGPVELRRLRVAKIGDITLDTTDPQVQITNARIKGAKTAPSTMVINAGVGSICDLTGSVFANATLTAACDTVIGP